MTETYSTYEAKAKLSEILRKMEAGATVRISRRGEVVAEIRPLRPAPSGLEQRIKQLAKRGALATPSSDRGHLRPVQSRPGALGRFLSDRNG